MKKKLILGISAGITSVLIIGVMIYSFSLVPRMFKMNAQLQNEGYYMGEFEFKMLGLLYYMDHGNYVTAFRKLHQLHRQMKTKEGLIKIPKFKNDEEKLDFYLDLQNPGTGAFMDESYPLFTYIDPTLNMIETIEKLSKTTGKTVKLKYPLRFLDRINTEENLVPYLNDLSSVDRWLTMFPATPYIAGVSQLGYYEIIERNEVYSFSDGWKEGLMNWLYRNQDSQSGYWGVEVKGILDSNRDEDLGSTFHILNLFMDKQGRDINSKYPLRYRKEMFQTTLRSLSKPMPADANLAEQHDWSLNRAQGIDVLARLWKSVSINEREQARSVIKQLIANRFKEFYKRNQGGFSLYSASEYADLDGTGSATALLSWAGQLPGDRRELLWGHDLKSVKDLGEKTISAKELESAFAGWEGVNSIRFCTVQSSDALPDKDIKLIYYPKEPAVLDIIELKYNIKDFLSKTKQEYGNWTSKKQVVDRLDLASLGNKPEIITGKLQTNKLLSVFKSHNEIVAVGFDELQIPKYKIKLFVER